MAEKIQDILYVYKVLHFIIYIINSIPDFIKILRY